MIKNFGQWIVVNDGIETSADYAYWHIPKKDIMNRNTILVKKLMDMPSINNESLKKAYKFAYRYFHAMTKYSAKSHPQIHREMTSEFNKLKWDETVKGNYTMQMPEGFNITVYKNDKDRWAWIYKDIHSKSSYKNFDTAQKKAFASYYWLYKHIKNERK